MNVLSLVSAFTPGSDLWLVPDVKNSRWTQKLDWYLNFQILRSQRQNPSETRNFTRYVQKETGLEVVDYLASKNAPLMITSCEFFPNKWVVVLPLHADFKTWVREAGAIWENLKEPTLRFFLPTGQSAGSFQKEWQARHNSTDYTLVLD